MAKFLSEDGLKALWKQITKTFSSRDEVEKVKNKVTKIEDNYISADSSTSTIHQLKTAKEQSPFYPKTTPAAIVDEDLSHAGDVLALQEDGTVGYKKLSIGATTDKYLTQADAPADAAAVGAAINAVNERIDEKQKRLGLDLFSLDGEDNDTKLFQALQTGGLYSGYGNVMALEYNKCTPPWNTNLGTAQYYILYRDNWPAGDPNIDVTIRDTIFKPEGDKPVLIQYMYQGGGSITYENCTFHNILFWFGQTGKKKIIFRNCTFEDMQYQAITCGEWNSNCEYIIENCVFRHMRPRLDEYRADVENHKKTGQYKMNGWAHGFMRVMGFDLTLTIKNCLFYDNMGSLNLFIGKSSHVDTVSPDRLHLYIEQCTFQKTNGAAISFSGQPCTGYIKNCRFINIGETRCNDEGYQYKTDYPVQSDNVYQCGVGANGIFSYNWTPRHELTISHNYMYNIMENAIEGNYREVSYNHIENTGYRMDEGMWNPSTEILYGNFAICRGNVLRNPYYKKPGIVIPSFSDGESCVIEDNFIEYSGNRANESVGIEIMYQGDKMDYDLYIQNNTIRGFAKKYNIYNNGKAPMPIHINDKNDTNAIILNSADYYQNYLKGVGIKGLDRSFNITRNSNFTQIAADGTPEEWGCRYGVLKVYTNGNDKFLRLVGNSTQSIPYICQDYRLGTNIYLMEVRFKVRSSTSQVAITSLSLQDNGVIVPDWDNRYSFAPAMCVRDLETDDTNKFEWHEIIQTLPVTENARLIIGNPSQKISETTYFDVKDITVTLTDSESRTFDNTDFSVLTTPFDFSALNTVFSYSNDYALSYRLPTDAASVKRKGTWADATWMMGKYTNEAVWGTVTIEEVKAPFSDKLSIWYKSYFNLDLNGKTLNNTEDRFDFIHLNNGAKVNFIGQGTISAVNYAIVADAGCELTLNSGITVSSSTNKQAILLSAGKDKSHRTIMNVRGGTLGWIFTQNFSTVNFAVPEGVTATVTRLQIGGVVHVSKDTKLSYVNSSGTTIEVTTIKQLAGIFHSTNIIAEYVKNHTSSDLEVTADESTVLYSYVDENNTIVEKTDTLSNAYYYANTTINTRQGAFSIKLLDNIYTYTGFYLQNGGNVTINLNSFNIINEYQNYAITFNGTANVTILDTDERENFGAISSKEYATIILSNGAKLTLASGIISQPTGICVRLANADTSFNLTEAGILQGKTCIDSVDNATINLLGGTIEATNVGVTNGKVTISGGEFTAPNRVITSKNVIFKGVEGKTATINGPFSTNGVGAVFSDNTKVKYNGLRVDELIQTPEGIITIEYWAVTEQKPATNVTLSHHSLTMGVGVRERLTYTLEPTDTTDIAKIKTDPLNIVTWQGGILTGKVTGTTTATVTAGSISDSCDISIIEITDAMRTVVYELPQPVKFVAANKQYLDTGIKLFEDVETKATDYTIFLDVAANTSTAATIFDCGGAICGTTSFKYRQSEKTIALSNNARKRLVIKISGLAYKIYYKNYSEPWQDSKVEIKNTTSTLLLGGCRDKDSYLDGTIYALKITKYDASEADIASWLNAMPNYPATSVTIDPSTITLTEGESTALTAIIQPSGTTDSMTWASKNPDIATVSNSGTVVAVKAGTAEIVATVGSVTASCIVTVNALPIKLLYVLPQATTITSTADVIDTGVAMFNDSSTYTVVFEIETSNELKNESDKYTLLDCSNTNNGYRIYARATSDQPKMRHWFYNSDSSIVWKPQGKRIRIVSLLDPVKKKYSYAPKDGDLSMADISINSAANITNTLLLGGGRDSAGNIARYWPGVIHNFRLYKGLWDKNRCQNWLNSTGSDEVLPTEILFSNNEITLSLGETKKLDVTFNPTYITLDPVWSCNGAAITVTDDGVIVGVSKGTATVTCTVGTVSASCNVTVTDNLTTLYTLPQETTFVKDVDTIIDTGVQMFADIGIKPFYTILLDVTVGVNATHDNCCLFHCMNESSPWPGITCHLIGNESRFQINMYHSAFSCTTRAAGKHIRQGIVLNGANWYSVSNFGDLTSTAIASYDPPITQTLLIGGYQTTNGVHGRFFDGTLHSFQLLQGAMTQEKLEQWVNAIEGE